MFNEIDITKEQFNPFEKIGKQWFLVTAGNEEKVNTMTASWGFMGVMWNKNTAVTVIRPQRFTKKLVDENEYFSLSFFPEEYRSNLKYCGANSGYNVEDKVAQSGLTTVMLDGVPAFEEAEMVLICKKLFCQQIEADAFVDKSLCDTNYASGDFHYAYIGEIIKAYKK